jgi:hypothetical protein
VDKETVINRREVCVKRFAIVIGGFVGAANFCKSVYKLVFNEERRPSFVRPSQFGQVVLTVGGKSRRMRGGSGSKQPTSNDPRQWIEISFGYMHKQVVGTHDIPQTTRVYQ